jgi:hypothetical protein
MNRLRVEGLLAAFPKLVGHSKQHTYVETDSVRYVYQPLENTMYLLLITTKASNIVEDLGTLRLLAKVVPDVAGGLSETAICDKAFELIFAFDEVLTAGGYKEDINLSTIRSNLLMDSHEEKIHMALKQTKEDQAKDEMRRQQKIIQERQMAHKRQTFLNGPGAGAPMGGMEGFGGGGAPSSSFGFDSTPQQQYTPQVAAPAPEVPKVLAKAGMKLGGGGGTKNNLMNAMAAEDNLIPMGGGGAGGKNVFDFGNTPAKTAATHSTPLTLVLEEKISVSMNREGGVEACEVKGTLTLTSNTDAGVMSLVTINKAALPASFSYATHPKVDKKMYESDGVLTLKGGKGFPVNRPVGILRWSYNGDDAAPLSINCWPEDEGGSINVNIEMELTRKDVVLTDVNILLPLGTTEAPVVESIDGQYKHDPRAGMLCWHFDQIDASNANGSMEFSIPGGDTDAFFPIQVGFRSETLLCPIAITNVSNATNGTAVPNQLSKSFVPESYQVA